jgi:hypothetical protein
MWVGKHWLVKTLYICLMIIFWPVALFILLVLFMMFIASG